MITFWSSVSEVQVFNSGRFNKFAKLNYWALWEVLVTTESVSLVIDNIVAVSFSRPESEALQYSNVSLYSPGHFSATNPKGKIKDIQLCSAKGITQFESLIPGQ